eukprot:Gb_03077 [translate_table: standard]
MEESRGSRSYAVENEFTFFCWIAFKL